MSRIGKLPIVLPDGVKCVYKAPKVTVEGPKGKLEKTINFEGKIKTDKDRITIISGEEDKKNKALYGLTRSLINSMVIGVNEGFVKTLKIVGVGYKAQMEGKGLLLNLGYSHPIQYPVPDGVKIDVPDMNTVVISGIDKQIVGQTASEIRKFRPPEPYKGKGVMYSDESIRRKAGKAGIK
jgi:large subunit ribosomal protein L6